MQRRRKLLKRALSVEPLERRFAMAAFVVTSGSDSGPGSLRSVIESANSNFEADTIRFAPSVTSVLLTSGVLRPKDTVTIQATGVTIRRSAAASIPAFSLFESNSGLTSTFTIIGGTLVNGDGSVLSGGAIRSTTGGNVVLRNVTLLQNKGSFGGAVYVKDGGDLTLDGVTARNNQASSGGAINVTGGGRLVVTNSLIENNTASSSGGGIVSRGFKGATISNTVIRGNSSGGSGGGASLSAPVDLNSVTFEDNQAGSSGGGLYLDRRLLTDSDIANSTFRNNSSASSGGGLFISNLGDLSISNSEFLRNSATIGGGILHEGSTQITNTPRQLFLNNSIIAANTSQTGGGLATGFRTYTEIDQSSISRNQASDNGGGISNNGIVYAVNSTIDSNIAGGQGGGAISLTSNSANAIVDLTLQTTTISGNQAEEAGAVYSTSNLVLFGVTIASNSARTSGGIFTDDTEFFRNAIVANNVATGSGSPIPSDVTGFLDDVAYSLIRSLNGTFGVTSGVNGNLTGVDPKLGPLRNNGGRTRTHAIAPTSPAVNAGDPQNSFGTLDQRGRPRTTLARVDMGSYEVQPNLRRVSNTYSFADYDNQENSLKLIKNAAGRIELSDSSTPFVLTTGVAVNTVELTGSFTRIEINTGGGIDQVLVDLTNGWPASVPSIDASLGSEADTLLVSGDVNMRLTNTTLTVSNGVSLTINHQGVDTAILKGGASSNRFDARGFNGAVALDGGAGNDFLFGGNKRNILIGGLGADQLTGGPGDDILIGGRTPLNVLAKSFQAIVDLWSSSLSYAARIMKLRTGTDLPVGLKLDITTAPDDNSRDVISGLAGNDWFWSYPTDALVDRLTTERVR